MINYVDCYEYFHIYGNIDWVISKIIVAEIFRESFSGLHSCIKGYPFSIIFTYDITKYVFGVCNLGLLKDNFEQFLMNKIDS